jgi:hypothetical protein
MIIGLVGKARSGKSTLAAHLVSQYGFVAVSFSDRLKDMLIEELIKFPPPGVLPPSREQLHDAFYIHRTPDSRWLLQFIGTNIVRRVDPDYWVKQAPLTHFADVVVPDVRFPNECAAIKERGGIIIRVIRVSGAGKIEHGEQHESETALNEYPADYTIEAPEGIETMKLMMDDLFQIIRKKVRKH